MVEEKEDRNVVLEEEVLEEEAREEEVLEEVLEEEALKDVVLISPRERLEESVVLERGLLRDPNDYIAQKYKGGDPKGDAVHYHPRGMKVARECRLLRSNMGPP